MAWQASEGLTFSMVGGGGPGIVPSRAGPERPGFNVLARASLPLSRYRCPPAPTFTPSAKHWPDGESRPWWYPRSPICPRITAVGPSPMRSGCSPRHSGRPRSGVEGLGLEQRAPRPVGDGGVLLKTLPPASVVTGHDTTVSAVAACVLHRR